MFKTKEVNDLNSFSDNWLYDQSLYKEKIFRTVRIILFQFPLAYLNFLVQLTAYVLSLPIFLGNLLEFFTEKLIIRKPKLTDIPKITNVIYKNIALENYEKGFAQYEDWAKGLSTFVLGVLTAFISVWISRFFHF